MKKNEERDNSNLIIMARNNDSFNFSGKWFGLLAKNFRDIKIKKVDKPKMKNGNKKTKKIC